MNETPYMAQQRKMIKDNEMPVKKIKKKAKRLSQIDKAVGGKKPAKKKAKKKTG